jgi:site-specific recombinase XerD
MMNSLEQQEKEIGAQDRISVRRESRGKLALRKLHIGHIAFMRAVVQGLDTKASWNRYLRVEGEHDDIRNVRKTIQWIRDEFAAAAHRHKRPGTARLVQIDVSRIQAATLNIPSLEEFAEEYGLSEFSETEQLEHYQARYGSANRNQSRRTRLIAKQLEALLWLENLVAQVPQSQDAVRMWLNPDLARHLERAGIFTLSELAQRINGIGRRWCAGIKGIGLKKGERIVEWMRVHESGIGLVLGAHIVNKRSVLTRTELDAVVPKATSVVPLEKLLIPPELNGRDGTYRAPLPLCKIPAQNDVEAILYWLQSKAELAKQEQSLARNDKQVDDHASTLDMIPALERLQNLTHTQRAYLKEAERFLLWAIIQRKKALSSMEWEDCKAYGEFMANPVPQHLWCGRRGREKWSPLWRPFEGPLSASAQRHAIVILKNLYKFLVDQGYLLMNPWAKLRPSKGQQPRAPHERSFTEAQWQFILEQLKTEPETSANLRLRFALEMLYAAGLRLSELVQAKVDNIQWISHRRADDMEQVVEGWQLNVKHKKGTRAVPIPPSLIALLSSYLASRGLQAEPTHEENSGAFILGKCMDIDLVAPWNIWAQQKIDPKAGISASALYTQLKTFFKKCGAAQAATDSIAAKQFAGASTYWLRHTHGMHMAAAGLPIEVVQQNLGHASLHTTRIYAKNDTAHGMETMRKLWKAKKLVSDADM